MLGQIEEEAEALDDMVRNLLAITRIDAHRDAPLLMLFRTFASGAQGQRRGLVRCGTSASP